LERKAYSTLQSSASKQLLTNTEAFGADESIFSRAEKRFA